MIVHRLNEKGVKNQLDAYTGQRKTALYLCEKVERAAAQPKHGAVKNFCERCLQYTVTQPQLCWKDTNQNAWGS